MLTNTNNSSSDMLPCILLKKCASSLTIPITEILRYSFILNDIPNIWKESWVFPLYKKADKNIVSNYRPITLNCSITKIMENIIYHNLYNFFEQYGLISPIQHGFVKGRSTLTQLLEVHDDWTLALENGYHIDVIFFDISKAFDSIHHPYTLC